MAPFYAGLVIGVPAGFCLLALLIVLITLGEG